jgi:polysaccharide export outer membrane protein
MVDLKEPDGYFLANNFFMKNKDMVFVSDAPSVDVVKLMTVVNSVVSTGRQGVGLGRDINTFHR